MARDWSPTEVDAIVADYFAMLAEELAGRRYTKAARRRELGKQLMNRSRTAIERKHMNISAVLRELQHPAIDGYKPLGNYQKILWEAVVRRLQVDESVRALVMAQVDAPASVPAMTGLLALEEAPPQPERRAPSIGRERTTHPYMRTSPGLAVDYLARECRNRSLGLAGEMFVMRFEAERLHSLGASQLSDRIEHVASTRGDAAGFDVLSFEADGRERFIEVKTTAFGKRTPFYVTRNEVASSAHRPEQYHLYRLFKFRESPRLFTVPGALNSSCRLEPALFIARVA